MAQGCGQVSITLCSALQSAGPLTSMQWLKCNISLEKGPSKICNYKMQKKKKKMNMYFSCKKIFKLIILVSESDF